MFTFNKNDGVGSAPHPTTKPTNLMCKLVQLFTLPQEEVLDPFMGSGTTGVACVRLDRRFVGIEINQKYFEVACSRIELAYNQPHLFIAPPPAKIIQEGFDL